MKTDLLDHGYIRMVSYTQPSPEPPGSNDYQAVLVSRQFWTGDLEIVRAARVSHNADWRPAEPKFSELQSDESVASKDEKLIHRLWKDQHTSPFEAMAFTFEVQAPIFVFRQWHRHRTQSYSEVSARYTELPDLFYIPNPEVIGYQDQKNKQGREGKHEYAENIAREIYVVSGIARAKYRELLDTGMTRELARLVLPVNTYSRMYATANLLNWFRFLTLRLDAHAQFEIRVYAQAMIEMLRTVCPIAVAAFEEENRPGVVKIP